MNKYADELDNKIKDLMTISDRPNLVALAYALRHPELWPDDFVWDYGDCSTCAIGLAVKLWPDSNPPESYMDEDLYNAAMKTWIARTMAMPFESANKIFFGLAPMVTEIVKKLFWTKTETYTDWESIHPEHVADAIDRYLASAE